MPPGPEVHGALVLVDAAEGVTPILRRALWHARRRGVRHLVGLVACEVADDDLLHLAELDLRHALDALGFAADEVPLCRLAWPDAAAAGRELLGALELAVPHGPLRRDVPGADEAAIEAALRRIALFRNGSERVFSPQLWADLRRGRRTAGPADDRWRLHAILHQAVRGDFDDLPDLLTIAAAKRPVADWPYRDVPLDLLAHLGTWELAPLLRGLEGDEVCEAMSYWLCLACVPVLLDLFPGYRRSDHLFIFPWAIQRILEEEDGGALDSRWERHVPDDDLAEFTAEAERRHAALVERLGSPIALALHGEAFSVRRVAELLQSCRARHGYDGHLARLFFAQTGVPPDPASVARFLAGRADQLAPARHFLGRPIADFSRESGL